MCFSLKEKKEEEEEEKKETLTQSLGALTGLCLSCSVVGDGFATYLNGSPTRSGIEEQQFHQLRVLSLGSPPLFFRKKTHGADLIHLK